MVLHMHEQHQVIDIRLLGIENLVRTAVNICKPNHALFLEMLQLLNSDLLCCLYDVVI